MCKKNYFTIKKNGQYRQVIKKSEFICYINRIDSEHEAQNFIDQINKEHNKARHICYAYLLGLNDEIQRESDNGEPAGTAGVPILNALKQASLHNVCAVVVRYFGGIKLGTGGLIRAYGGTTNQTISTIGIIKRTLMSELIIALSYSDFERAKYFFQQNDIPLIDIEYSEQITAVVCTKKSEIEDFYKSFTNYLNKPIEIQIGEEKYQDMEL